MALQLTNKFPFIKIEQRASVAVGSTPLSNPANWLTRLLKITGTGANVSEQNSLGVTALWRALKILGEGIASLEVEVFREDADGNKTKLPTHPVARLLREPSPLYTDFQFFELQTVLAAFRGNCFAIINRDGRGRARSLRYVHPSSVRVDVVGEEILYQMTLPSQMTVERFGRDVLHVANMALKRDFEGVLGLDLLDVHRTALSNAIGVGKYSETFVNNGISVAGALTHETKSLSKEKREETSRQVKEKFSGPEASGSVMVLDEGWKFEPINLRPEDSMFLNSGKLSVEDISRMTGVPMHLLSSLDRATFSNIEQQSREYVTYTLLPWAQRWEAEMNRKLFTESERFSPDGSRTYCKFNLEPLMRGDTEAQSKFIQVLMQYAIASPNEIRKRYLDWNSVEGGDERLTPANITGNNRTTDEEE